MSSSNDSHGTSEQSFMRLKTSRDLYSSLTPQRSSPLLSPWSLHFSPLASLLYLLPVPCAWNTLPRKSYGFLLPFFRSLPKCHLIREALPDHTIQNSNPYPFLLPQILPDDLSHRGKYLWNSGSQMWSQTSSISITWDHVQTYWVRNWGWTQPSVLKSSTVMIPKFKNWCSGLCKYCIT